MVKKMVNRQMETLKLRDRILNWKINTVLKDEKQKRKGKEESIQLYDSV